jgi:hypothetical protein
MILPEVGKTVVNERTGEIFLIFEYDGTFGKMVRVDEPLDIRVFGRKQLPEGYSVIELPAETMKMMLDRYKAVRDITKP